MNLTDTHCHLNFKTYRGDLQDVYGNNSILSFDVVSEVNDSLLPIITAINPDGIFFDFKKENSFSAGNMSFEIPANAFYQSFIFHFDSVPGDSTLFAPIYKLHDRFTPVHKSFTLLIKPVVVPSEIKDKMYIAVINKNGGWYIGSKWKGKYLSAKSRLLGDYSVKADTIAPKISPVNISDGKTVNSQGTIKIKISDKETGIKRYRPTLNEEWILMEYDPKIRLLVYHVDDKLTKGENDFKLVVTDLLGNETTYEAVLNY